MEQLLSVVKRRMEIKFLMICGETKTLLRTKFRLGKEKVCDPVAVTGSKAPLPTMIDEGVDELGKERVEIVPASAVMCDPAPESAYHSDGGGCWSVMVLKLCASVSWFHAPPWTGFQGAG
jgi:hypothetical protein